MKKKKTNAKRKYLIILVILLLLGSTYLYYLYLRVDSSSQYLIAGVDSSPQFAKVSNRTQLDFGTIGYELHSKKVNTISNIWDYEVVIVPKITGNISDFITIELQKTTLKPGEETNITFVFSPKVSENATYDGNLKTTIFRKIYPFDKKK